MTYEVVSYKDVPEYVQEQIDFMAVGSSGEIDHSEGKYIILIPEESKAVEVVSVELEKGIGGALVYKYKFVDEASENALENIKIIKVNHYAGNTRGTFVK